jgi:hypothetical protein
LMDVQQRYPVTEQELLAIVETLKYFRHMLLGHRIIIKTDHKNLIHPNSHHSPFIRPSSTSTFINRRVWSRVRIYQRREKYNCRHTFTSTYQ